MHIYIMISTASVCHKRAQAMLAAEIMRVPPIMTIRDTLTDKQEKILTIRNDNPDLTNQQIADLAETSNSYVSEVLQRYGLNKEAVNDYNKNKVEIWQGITARILSKISDEDIEKGSLQQKITAAGIAFDKTQVLTGGAREVTPMVIVNRISIDNKPVDNSDIITVDNCESL